MTRIIALIVLAIAPFANGSEITCNLHDAAKKGDITLVRNMLDADCEVNEGDDHKKTPLHYAIYWNRSETARVLIDAGVDIDTVADYGETALITASTYSDSMTSIDRLRRLYIMRMLLDAGAKVDIRGDLGRTALIVAANTDDIAVRMLLEAKADVEAIDEFGYSALRNAAMNNHTANVRLLLEAGANAKVIDGKLRPLTLAVAYYKNDPTIIRLLLEAGEDVNAKMSIRGFDDGVIVDSNDNERWTVLHIAAMQRNDSISTLIDAGADVNAKNSDGDTPLHLVFLKNEWDVDDVIDTIHTLIDAGADINAQNNDGDTVLHIAARKGKADLIPLLISLGSDERIRNNAMLRPVSVSKTLELAILFKNQGRYWPIKAYAMGNISTVSIDTRARIGCLDKKECRVFVDCTDKDGGVIQGSLDSDSFYRKIGTSIPSQATVSLSIGDIQRHTLAMRNKALDCALRSQQNIVAQVWSSTDSVNANTTAYRLSEAGKARVHFYAGEGNTPYINIRCIAMDGKKCTGTELKCTDDAGRSRSVIEAGTIDRLNVYTVSTAQGADYRITSGNRGWYSCAIESDGPFMVHATQVQAKGDSRSKTGTTSISME
ncbi:ankyrin repeat domain-containing protein [Thioalkalivibrio sp. HK1]|uniref:ankyrin repeat domain-containing protein n=1 Tax=Thioalkalivibrio sp. HK1 TaxID=1469245 RepID=UPI000471FE14|nr:ankyrin repeat domain-containing protein [Thioalkalivibrio sp. HK1]